MNKIKATSFALTFTTAAVLIALAACSSTTSKHTLPQTNIPNHSVQQQTASSFQPRYSPQSPEYILNEFMQFKTILQAAKNGNDATVATYLNSYPESAMQESIRNEWLINLGKRGNKPQFITEYAKLATDARNRETRCYAHYLGVEKQSTQFISDLLESTGKLPQGCNTLLQDMARQNALNLSRAWRRVRGLISNGQITDASNLAAALGSPLNSETGFGAQENLLRNAISPNAQKSPTTAAAFLKNISSSLNNEQIGFSWGVLALVHAKNQNMEQALQFYRLADRNQLNTEQFEWYARAALRLQKWPELNQIILSMPNALKNNPTWQYWLARSYAAQGQHSQATQYFQAASKTGRNFYAILATEALGQRINTQNTFHTNQDKKIAHLAKDGAIHHALVLYHTSKQQNNWEMRRQAQAQWRYATRNMDEATLLAAAQLAKQHEFYEMAINSAERADHLLDYNLRYLMPFYNLVNQYATENSVDMAWVYGLIRQESRFMIGAQSRVGAQGLMQVMPATANEIARKIGMDNAQLYTIQGNIRMGTWYMSDARRRLQGSEVLATAGYNAGFSRARRWQANYPLEGAIYAETIPFNETRDYVKKVMANTTYYSSLLGKPTSLTQRLGIIPMRS